MKLNILCQVRQRNNGYCMKSGQKTSIATETQNFISISSSMTDLTQHGPRNLIKIVKILTSQLRLGFKHMRCRFAKRLTS